MEIKELTILGKSDPVVTMIFDNLESNKLFPKLNIVNNLQLPIENKLENKNFSIEFFEYLIESNFFVLGVTKPRNKIELFNLFKIEINKYINIIHQSSQISQTSKIGLGCLINSLVSIAAHTNLGNFVTINRNSSIGHHVFLDDFVTINPGVNIAGFVKVKKGTLIGMGANIIDGVEIGENTIIGAGSLVTKNIPDNVIAYGNPCKIIKDIK